MKCKTGADGEYTEPSAIELSPEETAAINVVTDAFAKSSGGLFFIRVTDSQVLFQSYSSSYAVICVTKGIRPTESDSEYYIEKISWRFYQIIGK